MNLAVLTFFSIITFALAATVKKQNKYFVFRKNCNGFLTLVDLGEETYEPVVEPQQMTLYLYTNGGEDPDDIIPGGGTVNTNFDGTKKNIFLVHGWNDDYQSQINTIVKTAIFKTTPNVNVFVVDWGTISHLGYLPAKSGATQIGHFLADFINTLVESYHLDGSSFTLIGHSLGAHVTGCAGNKTSIHLSYIIGLDPAGPFYTAESTDDRLDPSDADYVQVIHSDGSLLGYSGSIGDVDYYPNGGMEQPGCGVDITGSCSHFRSIQLLAEAIECQSTFLATSCDTYEKYLDGSCDQNGKSYMGSLDADNSVIGNYYLDTNSKPPYGTGC